jgi:GH35 family endo-1,4-beta-xylanase
MMKRLFSVLILLGCTSFATALKLPDGGTELSDPRALQGSGPVKKGAESWQIRVAEASDAAYSAQVSNPLKQNGFQAGDFVLAIIKARSTDSNRGNLIAKLQRDSPYEAACDETAFDLTPAWTEYPVLFRSAIAADPGKASIVLFAGHLKQAVEVASIRVLRYPSTTPIQTFPRIRFTYEGREDDAPWRKAALERIEKIRKNELSLTLTDASGKPISGKNVRLVLRRHEFGFGSAVPAARIVEDSPNGEKFREIVDRLFSRVVFENDLKDFGWAAELAPHEKKHNLDTLSQAFDWLESKNIEVRGHYLMQDAVPPNLAGVTDSEAIRRHFITLTHERLDFVKNRVIDWDVINHPIAWPGADMLTQRQGLEKIDREILTIARQKSKLPLYVNEDQIFRPGRQSDETFNYIKSLNDEGFRIDGLGNQAHFHASSLPSPAAMLEVTERFASIVPQQQITEFDVNTEDDEQLAADFTRDILITAFSHPAYSGFLLWGFWEGSHWKKECASWNLDWTARKRGEVLEEWLGKRWRTEVVATTDANGTLQWRGFPGWYELTTPDQSTPILVRLSSKAPAARMPLAE